MIRRFNRSQTIKAIISAAGGIFCFGLTWLFFRYLPAFAAAGFDYSWSPQVSVTIAWGAVLIVAFSGWRTWQKGGGLHGYHESSLYHDLGGDTAGAMVVDYYADRVTAPAYALGQLFLAAPLLLLRAGTLLASRVSDGAELEARLGAALTELRTAHRWQFLAEYPQWRDEILYLARMGLIDFAGNKGQPRIKSSETDGT